VPFLELEERDVIAQTASQAFDISVWQLVTGLTCGARIEIFPDEIAHDALAFADHLRATGATIVESVPTLIQHLLAAAGDAPLPLRVLITTGEAMQPELAARWLERYPEIPLLNAYGPAECADDVALAWIRRPPARDGVRLSVGTATDNNRLHVLDADLGLVPRGAAGELCVAGIGVGRGYLGDAARTAEKFVPNPYATSPGERLYRTGDAACWVSDGTLEFVGRRDHQLKIRGARVEPGEIEARLLRHPSITSAVVVARRAPTGKQLVAYHTCSPGPVPSAEELKTHLRAGLPDFMIPTQFCALERLPTTPNGKIDRQALPEPEWTSREVAQPSTEAERVIAGIWQQVLGVATVGRHDNFFELGGDSLLAAQVLSRLQRGLGVRLTLRQVLTAPDLAALAALAEGAGRGGGVAAARATDLEAMIRDVASP
jgi:acyl-coenzyme A synthetase/AMP-(fatty) acid ligase